MTDITKPIEIQSPAQLDEILATHKYVVADFKAAWCGPCHAIAPIYEKLAKDNGTDGQLAFVKVDVDEQQEIAQRFNIMAMPTFLFFEDGKEVPEQKIRGADPRKLTAQAGAFGKLAKASAAEPKKVDAETVSGGYSISKDEGGRGEWKTSLNA